MVGGYHTTLDVSHQNSTPWLQVPQFNNRHPPPNNTQQNKTRGWFQMKVGRIIQKTSANYSVRWLYSSARFGLQQGSCCTWTRIDELNRARKSNQLKRQAEMLYVHSTCRTRWRCRSKPSTLPEGSLWCRRSSRRSYQSNPTSSARTRCPTMGG